MQPLETKYGSSISSSDGHETKTSPISSLPNGDYHSSIHCHTFGKDYMLNPTDKSSSSAEYIYTEIIKAIGNNEFIEEKRLLKRASWSPAVLQEYGLPPTGKRTDNEQLKLDENSNLVHTRPKIARNGQSQQNSRDHYHQTSFGRPISYNERCDRHLVDNRQRNSSNSLLVSSFIKDDLKYVR